MLGGNRRLSTSVTLIYQLVWYLVAFCRLGWPLGTKCSADIPGLRNVVCTEGTAPNFSNSSIIAGSIQGNSCDFFQFGKYLPNFSELCQRPPILTGCSPILTVSIMILTGAVDSSVVAVVVVVLSLHHLGLTCQSLSPGQNAVTCEVTLALT